MLWGSGLTASWAWATQNTQVCPGKLRGGIILVHPAPCVPQVMAPLYRKGIHKWGQMQGFQHVWGWSTGPMRRGWRSETEPEEKRTSGSPTCLPPSRVPRRPRKNLYMIFGGRTKEHGNNLKQGTFSLDIRNVFYPEGSEAFELAAQRSCARPSFQALSRLVAIWLCFRQDVGLEDFLESLSAQAALEVWTGAECCTTENSPAVPKLWVDAECFKLTICFILLVKKT